MATFDIACCYFPTKVMFVDDQREYLEHIALDLNDNLACLFHINPTEAIARIKEHNQPAPFIKQWSQNLNRSDEIELGRTLEDKIYTHNFVDIDVPAIHQQIYSPTRFNEISLVIVDYAMPNMNGLQFCEQLKDLPIKKLMLTGQADHELGVQALNDGIIDKFIMKGSANFNDKLNQIVEDLQYQYFYDLSDVLIQNLAINPYCCLDNHEFIGLFDKARKEHNIVEYYLVKDTGCFLMLDIDGNPSWLAVKTELDMQHDYQSAVDNDAPEEIIKDLKEKRRVIFQLTANDLITYTKENWQHYSHPATKLPSENKNMYYSVIKGDAGYDINTKKIASYKGFLHTQ